MSRGSSPHWYRVANLRPALRSHARTHRHVYRGETWYVIEDPAQQRSHRMRPPTYALVGAMDGSRTLDALWRAGVDNAAEPVSQEEMVQLLIALSQADLLHVDAMPDLEELDRRETGRTQKALWSKFLSPLAIRIPLFDPDRFLQRCAHRLRAVSGKVWFGLWIAVLLPAILTAAAHSEALASGAIERALTPTNLLLLWLLFPVIKALHELGHGLVARAYGCEIHEMGVMLLVLTPVPYVDASSTSALPEKHRRIAVAAAGMLVESFLAGLAVLIWASVEPGLVRALAFDTILVAGVTTIAFNANPLLRFDGYYILSDWLEIPNLRARSNALMTSWFESRVLGHKSTQGPSEPAIEQCWLVLFAVASFLYRMVVIAAIIFFLFDLSLFLGTVLTAISMVTWIGIPLVKGVRYFARSAAVAEQSQRTLALGSLAALTLLAFLLFPFPFRTQTEGVVRLPDDAFVRAQTAGEVFRVEVESGEWVEKGRLLAVLGDPDLETEIEVLNAQIRRIKVQHATERLVDRARADMLLDEKDALERRRDRALEKKAGLHLHAQRSGRFVSPLADSLSGRFLEQGELVGHLVGLEEVRTIAAVPQEAAALLASESRGVAVRLAENLSLSMPASFIRIVPSAAEQLPSAALGTEGGGAVAVDPRLGRSDIAVRRHVQIELELPPETQISGLGGRVYIQLDHGYAPLAVQSFRALRQLVLTRLDL